MWTSPRRTVWRRFFDELGLPYVKSRDLDHRRNLPGNARESGGAPCGGLRCGGDGVRLRHGAGQYRGKEVYQFLYTADSLAGSEWNRGLMGQHPESAYERYLSIALETAVRLEGDNT